MSADRLVTPLLSVKQAIPPVRPGSVHRLRLEERLGTSSRLTVVVAPAGWGKTSLLSGWALSRAARSPVAWLSLDEGDDEPVRFWSYVLTALARSSDQISTAALEALPVSAEGPMAQALPILLNELADATSTHVLVLDDFHVITNRDVHESLEFLLVYLPSTLQVVIGSRADPPLPLARMRVRGELIELRADDLRFRLDESDEMVSALTGPGSEAAALDSSLVRAVWERTEGWAAGLQLAGLTLRTRAEATAADRAGNGSADPAAALRGENRHLFDYFTAEVFPALTAAQRDLLTRAAPLELLSGSLCDAALGVQGSAQVLAELERADLFVVALDHEGEWFRCHRLLRDALGWSQSGPPDAAAVDVLRRAAEWFGKNRRVDDAARHLLAAGLHEEAELLLRDEQLWFLETGSAAMFLGLAERLPEELVHPQLALQLAYAADISGRRDQVVHWLDVGHRRIDEATTIAGWRTARGAELALRGAIVTELDATTRIAMCEEAAELEAAGSLVGQPTSLAGLGAVYAFNGQYERGAQILADVWAGRGQGHWSRSLDLQVAGVLTLTLLRLDRLADLDRVLAEAGPIAAAAEQNWGGAAAPVVFALYLANGRRSYLSGDLPAAKALVERGLEMTELAGRPTFQVMGLAFLADIEQGMGQRALAQATLVRARELADNTPLPALPLSVLMETEARIGRSAVRAANSSGRLIEELTDRELAILRMLPGTASQREIGAALFISINTVKAYNKSLYRKLGVGSRSDAVRVARGMGLI